MIKEFIRAFLLIFAAEMGDKSQILAMMFATQYKVTQVLSGVTLGVFFNHGIAMVLGSFISTIIPLNVIQMIAGGLFVIFGLLALNVDYEDDVLKKKTINPIITIASAFFIGELGDKTQLTAMTLAAETNFPIIVLLGTTLGMVGTSGIGIFIGKRLGSKIPEVLIKVVSSLVFLLLGLYKLLNSLPKAFLSQFNIMSFIIILTLMELILFHRLINKRKTLGKSNFKEVATHLYKQSKLLEISLDSICLGESHCGKCSGSECLIGYTRYIIKEARISNNYYSDTQVNKEVLLTKEYDRRKVMQALILIVNDYSKNGWMSDEDFVINKIKASLELILFGKSIGKVNNIKNYLKQVKKLDKDLATIIINELG